MTEEIRRNREYSVGIDIGTTSIGWAVIDNNYKLLKKGSDNLWGSYLFEEGQTAVERRTYRSNRRRMNRRKRRISLLKTLVGEMVLNTDSNFFMKMEKGHVKNELINQKYNLFNDGYSEKEYYKQFPTIYHLRNALCINDEKIDARLIYLALHHIIKYRGNFLYEGQEFNVSDKSHCIEKLKEVINDLSKIYTLETFENNKVDEILDVLTNTKVSKKERMEAVTDILKDSFEDKSRAKALVNLLLGYKCDLSKLFNDSCVNDEEKGLTISFISNKYDEELAALGSCSQEFENIILACNVVYSFIQLQDILDIDESDTLVKPSISNSMIKKYEQHKTDLYLLKKVIKEYFDKDVFNDVFKNELVKGNYYNYINDKANTPQNDENSFSKYIKTLLMSNDKCKDDSTVVKILNKIENKEFMPKQNTKDNGVIPYQLHMDELKQILHNQMKYYPVLEKNYDKIISLLTFRIPYYIGPLSNINNTFSWIVKKDNKAIIYPWNFEDVVDIEQSAESFIRRMTNQCTYLWNEEVLPKKSLIYSKYEVLNELNKINVVKKDKSGALKREIFNELFMKVERVTEKKLREFLTEKGYECIGDIKGFQKEKEFATSLEPWIKFKKIFPNTFDQYQEDIETMIEWITVYEDKKILETRLKNNFSYLKNEEINKICKLKFSGWGRLSKAFLVDMRCSDEEQGAINIMDVLYDTNMNLMQIITDKKLGFKEKIEELNKEVDDHLSVADKINAIPCSPAVKKGIRQAVAVLNDIVHYMKGDPAHIFIEFAREDQDSKRTDTRLVKIAKKYENIDKNGEYKQVMKELNEKLKDKAGIKSKSLLLYFLQGAKCLYTGESLNIDELNLYQIDHILPQSYIKDDSIDNLALVKSSANQYKGSDLLIDSTVQERQKKYWYWLKEKGLMSDKKFNNLTRTFVSPLEEMNFINRQLVETRQITKHVANLFKQEFPNTLIGAIKAGLSSDFRTKFDIYKIRNLNDYHHAHDAYIASVIGNFVLKAYPSLKREFIFEEYVQLRSFKEKLREMQKMIKQNKQKSLYGFVLNQMDTNLVEDEETGEIIWDEEVLKSVLKAFDYKDCRIVKKAEETLGSMHNITLSKLSEIGKKETHKIIPRGKELNDIDLYGGYTRINPAHMAVISASTTKGKMRKLVNVPIIYKDDKSKLKSFLEKELDANEIAIEKIVLMNQKIKINDGSYYLASATEWNNATQLILSKSSRKTVYQILKGKEVSNEEFENYLNEHLNKLKKYYPLYINIYNKLKSEYNKILLLNIDQIKQFVTQLIVLTSAKKGLANLAIGDLKLTKNEGRITNKNCNLEKCEFIFSSPTGIYVKRTKL